MIEEIVKEAMQEQDLALRPFAKKLGVSHQTVNNWLNGHARPTYRTVLRLERDHPASDWRGVFAFRLRKALEEELLKEAQ